MRALPKQHTYNLFLEKEAQYLLVFCNKRTYSIMLGLTMCGFFWGIYLGVIFPLADTFPFKTPLSYAFLMMGGMSLLALFHFVSAHESLTVRKINHTVEYEYHSIGGRLGWKKRFGDFQHLQIYKDPAYNQHGKRSGKIPVWHFNLVTNDDLRITIHPPGLKPFMQDEEAIAFAEKIARFMDIRVEKLVHEYDNQ